MTLLRARVAQLIFLLPLLFLPQLLWGGKTPYFAPVSLTASLRTRYEVWNWFKSESGDHNYSFAATRLRVGLRYDPKEWFSAFAEVHNTLSDPAHRTPLRSLSLLQYDEH